MDNKKGFTLIELVVAIAILGVITLFAIPTVNRIQAENQTTKYEAYEKSIRAASKAYTDGLDEDLFGATNTGCAIIKYSDLKTKDLIEDIQVKGVKCDKDDETFVFVMKGKDGNYSYFSNIVCRYSDEIVYSHKEENRNECGLEDGNPPVIDILFNPDKNTYFLGDNPKALIKISDSGIGLKENQKVKYTWYKNGEAITSTNTLEFKNKNYQGKASRFVEMPSDLENINEPTNYELKVISDEETGKLCDVDLNCTDVDKGRELKYFVGALLIKYKAAGGSMINPHGNEYSIDTSSDYILRNGEPVESKIKYNSSADLLDYNEEDKINIRKEAYYLESGKEWKWGSKVFGQNTPLNVEDFDYTNESIKTENKTVEVTANWKPAYKIVYMRNQSNSDTVSKTEYKKGGISYSIAKNEWANGTKTFLGWATEQNATDSSGTWYDPDSSYTTDEALKLYAQWYDIGSLESLYTTFVQSGDLIDRLDIEDNYNHNIDFKSGDDFKLNNKFSVAGALNNKFGGLYGLVGVNGIQTSNDIRPFQSASTYANIRVQVNTDHADIYQNYLTYYKRNAHTNSDKDVDTRIDMLQDISDTALTYDSFTIKRCKKENVQADYKALTTYPCSADSNNKMISAAGVAVSGTYESRAFVSHLAMGDAVKGSDTYPNSSGYVRVLATDLNTTINVDIESDFLEYGTLQVSHPKFKPATNKGKARYTALKALDASKGTHFPASYIKTSIVYTDTCGELSGWTAQCSKTKTVSVPSGGIILGVVGWGTSNDPNYSDSKYCSYGLLNRARLSSNSISSSKTLQTRYYVGNYRQSSEDAGTMIHVRSFAYIRYISSGDLSVSN